MSLDDDYCSLRAGLRGADRRALDRVWAAFTAAESEVDDVRQRMVSINKGLTQHAERLAQLNKDTSIK